MPPPSPPAVPEPGKIRSAMHSVGMVGNPIGFGKPLERMEARDLDSSGVLEAALRERSFRGEAIFVVGDSLASDFLANAALNLRQHGFEHWLLVSLDRVGCLRLQRLNMPCLWSSRLEVLDPSMSRLTASGIQTPHGPDLGLARSYAVRERALRLQAARARLARAAGELGYSALVMEPEWSLRADPYPALRAEYGMGPSRKEASLFLVPNSCGFEADGGCCNPLWAGPHSHQVFPCVSASLVYLSVPIGAAVAPEAALEVIDAWHGGVERELQRLRRANGRWNVIYEDIKRDLTMHLNYALLRAVESSGDVHPPGSAASGRVLRLKSNATAVVGVPLQWSAMRIPREWAIRHTEPRAYGHLVGVHLAGDHFLRSKRFIMRAYGWWHYEAGAASESGYHYSRTSSFMALDAGAAHAVARMPAAGWREAAHRLAQLARAIGYVAVLPEVECSGLEARGWAEADIVVAGYAPLRCYFNTGRLWSAGGGFRGTAVVKCGDQQLLHPAAPWDENFRAVVPFVNHTLDLGPITSAVDGDGGTVAEAEFRAAVESTGMEAGHVLFLRPPAGGALLPRLAEASAAAQQRLSKLDVECPLTSERAGHEALNLFQADLL